ncbi:Acetolactate synthase isozyme 2 large subunit [Clostridium sp. N3C]|uniref:thiamine pyrophosphate-binding protein n=1 Tax=Clostridium sp. N3C TaxID=1776758 RepID=UPI00092E0945|nr:thiamine pyrophosphate-binding protein [Clostridium sp. N3C]SCN21519.1 Acetolactate synthase isozyme 2 large subunit [Clostridium sp. N3C]
MRIADGIVRLLEKNEVKYIFGIPASTFAAIHDSLNDSKIEYIITKNEAGATYSASKYADTSNKLGVCLLAGGVGVNNGINGIADANRNKVPMLIISGDVRQAYSGKGAIQEFDNVSIGKVLCKHSYKITKEEEVFVELQKAIDIAMTPPCGPVMVVIPTDIPLGQFDGNIDIKSTIPAAEYDDEALDKAIAEINKAKKGLILVGRGAKGISKEVKELSEKLQWGIISTPNGKGVVNTDFPYYIGNYGFCTADGAVEYVENEQLDCVLVLGSSLGQTATRDYKDVLVRDRKVIRIDWDKREFNKVFKEDISVYYDLKKAVVKIIENVSPKETGFVKPEMNKPYVKDHTGVSLRLLFEQFPKVLPKNSTIVCDMGEFFNYAFKYMPIREDVIFQTSINYACMGTAVAGVMGSYLADKSRTYVTIVGDGAFYMNGMDIITAKEYNMPIIYFIINNSMMALVKNGTAAVFGRPGAGKLHFLQGSIKPITEAMGIETVQITEVNQIYDIKDLMVNRTSPLVVEVITDGSEVFIDTDRVNVMKSK